LEAENVQLDLNYIPRYINSSIKKFAPDERHVSRYNRQNILILVFEGSLCFEEDGDRICLEGGEYYIQTMGHWQTGNFPSNSPRYCFINFSGQFTDRADRALAIRGSFEVAALEPICKNLCAVQRSLAKSADVGMVFEVQRLFFDVLNGLYKGNIDLAQKKSLAERIYDHITEHFAEEISLRRVAERLGLSYAYLSDLFLREAGVGFKEYLDSVRLTYAKNLITLTDLSVGEVCERAGFADYANFSRRFRSAFGMSAREMRQKERRN
jgi:AraC-like DNA-binding protein